ncbi:MAG: branched-chain amino acid ABC transporter ATP-binding protein/permease [Syntrophobacteraceae bacterium]
MADIEREADLHFSRPAFVPTNWKALLAFAAAMMVLPVFFRNDYFYLFFNILALNAIVVLGLNLLIGSTGQVSLGHAAFYGLGAYISAIASTTFHIPLPLSLCLALGLVALASFLLALPTLRLEGHYLVMATLGFNIIVSILFGQLEGLTGGPSGFPGIPKLHVGPWTVSTDREFYYFIWTSFLIIFALTLNLTGSRVGRALMAIHEKELTAKTLAIPTYGYKVATFVLSAVYAGFAGFCYAHYITFISPKTFDIFYSVQVVTMVAVGGMGSLWGGLAGTALLTSLPELLHQLEDLQVLLYGLILMAVLVACPKGLFPALAAYAIPAVSKISARLRRPATVPSPDRPRAGPNRTPSPPVLSPPRRARTTRSEAPILRLEDISLSFGGLQALCEVGLEVSPGEIVALIGPNGAGKTTVLNVVSGLLGTRTGAISLDGADLSGLSPHKIAARGIGRTFQAVQVFHGLSVLDNLLLGYHKLGGSGFVSACLRTPAERGEEERLRREALDLLEDFDLRHMAHCPVQQLGLLDQKVLEIARALAISPRVLLLDEPAGGLNPRESEFLMVHISALRSKGIGVVLVEHDMNMVMRLADRIYVLQHGRLIASGTPSEIRKDPRVIAAYLGTRQTGASGRKAFTAEDAEGAEEKIEGEISKRGM